MRRLFAILTTLVLCGVLAACGFQLRGAYSLPFDTLYIALPETDELRVVLKRNIEASTQTRVVAEAKAAQATLHVTGDSRVKNVLSISSAGRVSEFELVRAFSFRVSDAAKHDLAAPGQIIIRRDVSFSDAQLLSKESEEALIWRDIQNDLVQQLMRRLAAAKPQAVAGR